MLEWLGIIGLTGFMAAAAGWFGLPCPVLTPLFAVGGGITGFALGCGLWG